MATALQRKLDQAIKNSALQYDGLNDDLQRYAIREIERVRLELQDLLMDYSNSDNIITKIRLQSLMNELDAIERMVHEQGMKAMQSVIKQSAEASIKAGSTAFSGTLGQQAVINGAMFNAVRADVVRYVVNRMGKDGLILSDRVWQFAGDQRAELEAVIRSGIIRGESVNTLIAKVRKVYANETWKIRRLVVTEGNVAYRTATAYTAQRSQFVKGLRIHRGIKDNPEHRCSELEKLDRYGLGRGIYLPSDPEVLNPHPNCTSYVTYELVEEGALNNANAR